MPGFDHDHRAARPEFLFEEADHLLGEALLELRPLGVELENARELGQAQDLVAWHVRDVRVAVEGHQVMRTHGVERDVLLHDHRPVVLLVRKGRDSRLRTLIQAAEHLQVHPRHPLVGGAQVRLVQVEPEFDEHVPNVLRKALHPLLVRNPDRGFLLSLLLGRKRLHRLQNTHRGMLP